MTIIYQIKFHLFSIDKTFSSSSIYYIRFILTCNQFKILSVRKILPNISKSKPISDSDYYYCLYVD